jgi:hypothetical protein
LGIAGARSIVGITAKAGIDYRPSRADLLQISTNLNGKRLTPQGYRLPSFTANIGYRHRFRSGLSAVLSMSDIFNSQRERSVIDTATFIDTSTRRNTRRIVSLALSVPFGGGRSNSDAAIDFGD